MKGIYKITSPSKRIYIGQTVNLDERFDTYRRLQCKAQRLLYNSLKKYGFENHVIQVIEQGDFTEKQLDELEIYHILHNNSFRGWNVKGMNLTTGGDGGIMDISVKEKISNTLKKYHSEVGHSEETKQKIANTLTGRKQSQELKDKRAETNRKVWRDKDLQTEFSKAGIKRKREKNAELREQVEIRNQEIINLLKDGIRQDHIARRYNLSPSVITQLKKKYNVQVETDIRKGQNNNFSKLTEQQVKEIKILLKNKTKQQEIADLYNVKLRTIKAIQSGQNWSHITIE